MMIISGLSHTLHNYWASVWLLSWIHNKGKDMFSCLGFYVRSLNIISCITGASESYNISYFCNISRRNSYNKVKNELLLK